MSHHLVRKLIKAIFTEGQDASVVRQAEIVRSNSQRKRKQPSVDLDDPINEDAVVAWHTKLLLATDRTMAFSGASNSARKSSSNVAAMSKLKRRKELQMHRGDASRGTPQPTGAARTTTSRQSHLVKTPTYNKERHEKERHEKKRMKLANALEKLHSTKKSKARKPKTIFG